jgi:tRNA pseudouridine55 synthase
MTISLPNDAVFALINKPEGITSQDCVTKIKRGLGCSKVGHGGTLDPFATGALPVFFESWTRLASLFSMADKRYEAILSLGKKTDTGDKTGEVVAKGPSMVANQANCKLLERSLIGKINLPIPIYSALKVDGVPMHQLARQGHIKEPLKNRDTEIYKIQLNCLTADSIAIDVTCSHGTYIRSLGEHIASKLKTQGHLTALHRTAYYLDGSRTELPIVSLDEFLKNPTPYIVTKDQLVNLLPQYYLNQTLLRDFLIGRIRRFPIVISGWHVIYVGERLVGVVFLENGKITQRVNLQSLSTVQVATEQQQNKNNQQAN